MRFIGATTKPIRTAVAFALGMGAVLAACGGAAYRVATAIKKLRVVGFADLGMEAIYEFEVKEMPVTVAVDASGASVHATGPREWQARIGKTPVTASRW